MNDFWEYDSVDFLSQWPGRLFISWYFFCTSEDKERNKEDSLGRMWLTL